MNEHGRQDRYFWMKFSKHCVSMEEYVHQVCQGVKSAFRGARGICIHWFHAGMKLQWATYLYLPYEECRVFLLFFPFCDSALPLSAFLPATQQPVPLTALFLSLSFFFREENYEKSDKVNQAVGGSSWKQENAQFSRAHRLVFVRRNKRCLRDNTMDLSNGKYDDYALAFQKSEF